MFKIILFSAQLCAIYASSSINYEALDHSSFGSIDTDEIRPHYIISDVQSHIPIEFSEDEEQDLILEDEIGKPLEQLSVEANPKYPHHSGFKLKQGNYKGSDRSSQIKQKKHSYESTKVSQEHIEVKSVAKNHYDSSMPHQQHKQSSYNEGSHAPSKDIYKKKLSEEKKESGEPGVYSHSIGEKNQPKQRGNKHYHHQKPEAAQEHIEPDFKEPSMKYGHHAQNLHAPNEQRIHESGQHPKYGGHKSAYQGHSIYKMNNKQKETGYQKPQTHGIYREGPKKHQSNYHNSGHKPHHFIEPSGNYHHGIKGTYTGPQLHKDSGYKSFGGNSGYLGISRGNNDHYNHGGSGFRPYHPGHYNQKQHSSIKTYNQPAHKYGNMAYSQDIGPSAGYKNIQSGYGIPRSNSGYHGISGHQYGSPMKHYSGSSNYHKNTHNIKMEGHYPKSIKTSGHNHHSLGGNYAPGYSKPIMPSSHHNSGSGHRVYTVPLIRTGHHSQKSYSEPKLNHHIDYSPKSEFGGSGYHAEKSPSYPKIETPHKPHYQAEHHPKPSYSSTKGGHHVPKEYHGIGENNAKPSYTHSEAVSSGTSAHRPTYSKSHSVKGGYNGPGHKHGISSETEKKYLPITASHGNNYKSESSGSPNEKHKYMPTKIEQKDIGYEALLGGHGGPGSISSGSGYKSNENLHKYKPSNIEQKHIGYESHLGGHGRPEGISSGSGYGSSESSHKYKPSNVEQKGIGYEALLGGQGDKDPAGISSGIGYRSSGSSGSYGRPSSSSHEVYGSDDKYEMSKPMPYEFKYEVKDDEHGADHYREEKMDDNGYLTGRYGYKDPHGLYRQVEYEASKAGFKVSSIKTNEPGTDNKDPADVHFEVEQNSQSHY